MNSEISYNNSVDNPGKNISEKLNGIINLNLLWDNIKRNKVLIIIIGIVMFFASPFIEILARTFYDNNNYTRDFYEIANDEVLDVVFVLMIIVSIIFGLCLAISGMRYMHDRKASVFFGSIPVKKRVFFTTQCLSSIIYFTAPLILAYIMSVIFLPTYLTFVTLTKIFSICWFIFLLVYSFTVMCANIAGSSFNTVISAGYLSVIAVIFFLVFAAFTETFYRFTQILSVNDMTQVVLLPVIYFIVDIIEQWIDNSINLILLNMLFMFIVSIAFLFIGGLLNKINKTENAEKPFYFKISLVIFKYTVLAIAVILSGLGFYQALRQDIFYMVLGIIVGGFLAFLVINFIIYKSIREVFNGFRKFGIFIIAASLVMTVFTFDIFGIDRYVPETSKVESVEFSATNGYMFNYYWWYNNYSSGGPRDYNLDVDKKITDPETIELISNVLKAAMKSKAEDSYNSYNIYSSDYNAYESNIGGATIKYNLKNGQTANKKIPYNNNLNFNDYKDRDEYMDAAKKLLKNKSYLKASFAPVTDKDFMQDLISKSIYPFYMTFSGNNNYYNLNLTKNDLIQFIEKVNQDISSDEIELLKYNYDTYLNINLSIPLENTDVVVYDFSFNLNDSFKNTLNFIQEMIAAGKYIADEDRYYD